MLVFDMAVITDKMTDMEIALAVETHPATLDFRTPPIKESVYVIHDRLIRTRNLNNFESSSFKARKPRGKVVI